MALDSSVMNVSIATVAEDLGTTITGHPDRHRALHAGHGDADGHWGQGRVHHRAEARLHDRLRDLLLRLADDSTVAQPRLAHLRMVVPRRCRRGPDHAGDRGARRRELPGSERPRSYGSWARPGRSPWRSGPLIGGLATTYASWRVVFAGEVLVGAGILVLARRVADAPSDEPSTSGLARFGAVGRGDGFRHHRRASLVRLGMGPSSRRRAFDPRDVAGRVVRPGRARADVAVHAARAAPSRPAEPIRSSAQGYSPTGR